MSQKRTPLKKAELVDAVAFVLDLLNPGPRPPASAVAMRFNWMQRQNTFEKVKRALCGPSLEPDEPVEELGFGPDEFSFTGWTDWVEITRNIYRGLYEVKIWHLQGLYAVFVGSLFLDCYDDLNEAKAAAVAYVEAL